MGKISFIREQIVLEVADGTTLLEAQIQAGLHPDAPCGGQGKCGKCLVKVNGQIVKACTEKVSGDMEVDTFLAEHEEKILTEGLTRPVPFSPSLVVTPVILEKAAPGDNRSDWERLCAQINVKDALKPNLKLAASIYDRQREQKNWFAVHTDDEIIDLMKEEKKVFMAAFDVGTTTVVGYLLSAEDGSVKGVESCMNPQAQYGADVIMRANYALEQGVDKLSGCIREAVDNLLEKLARSAQVEKEQICQISVVGNTCMHHLFLGISPGSLVHSPYNPAFRESLVLKASDYDLHVNPGAVLLMLPNIAGYVGADTCGCLLALRQDTKNAITLMIDIGTNGEMILGNKEKLATCSTAAGPAFEGAKIECGMRGAAGAVDHVSYVDGKWNYTTVGNEKAVGLCGSGLIDLVAEMYKAGLIDDMGHMESGQENTKVFVLVPPEEAGNDRGVFLTQKDVREVQLAKAAIAAGIQLLMQEIGIEEDDITKVYIAGAFGNYMNPDSACAIGMMPLSLRDRIEPVGNAAGEGAKIALLNKYQFKLADKLVKEIHFVELANSPDFQDIFVDELAFPEED